MANDANTKVEGGTDVRVGVGVCICGCNRYYVIFLNFTHLTRNCTQLLHKSFQLAIEVRVDYILIQSWAATLRNVKSCPSMAQVKQSSPPSPGLNIASLAACFTKNFILPSLPATAKVMDGWSAMNNRNNRDTNKKRGVFLSSAAPLCPAPVRLVYDL